MYDGDIESSTGIPDKVKALGEKILAADGVFLCTPEYNYGPSACAKNIIDWLSRINPIPLKGKPMAIGSVSAGPSCGYRAQYDVRKYLLYLQPHVMNFPDCAVSENYMKFDMQTGDFKADEKVEKMLPTFFDAFFQHIEWVNKANA